MDLINQLAKSKSKRFLILSAGGQQSGIQGIYVNIEGDAWSIMSHAFLPYPSSIGKVLDAVMIDPQTPLTLETISTIDHKISHLFLECAKAVCANTQKSLQQPSVIVLNKFNIWKTAINENTQAKYWDIELGDAQLLSSAFKAPVVTDFVRHGILGGKQGDVPLFPGICRISLDKPEITAHLTIGQLAHLFVYDIHAAHMVLDTDVGPGTCLINRAAKEALCPDGFDRDGLFAAQGKVDTQCLESLALQEWFMRPSPKQAGISDLMKLYDHACTANLTGYDKLATLTALTARSAFDLFKREYRHVIAPEIIWVSGGGANNLTIMEFLKTYFSPLPLKRTDEIGIPAELFVPLALGLTVDSFCMGQAGAWKSGSNPEIEGIGTWVLP
jgi:Predicted molecular chaperone distantly related to HSP70-fold metalloproteases